MANNLKKVSGLNPMNPDQMEATDLFYYVHADDESQKSWSLTLADLFIGSNNLTSDIKFNNDTLYIKYGKIGINGSPNFAQTVQISGSLFVSTYANVSSYLITGGNITAGNDLLVRGSSTVNGSSSVIGSSSVNGDLFVYGTSNINSLKSTNVNPRSTYTELINIIYPVGSIYTSTISTNPNTLFGIGTWAAYGEGRVLVGYGTGVDSRSESKSFSAGVTGGEYNHLLTYSESGIPAHNHTATDSGHTHTTIGRADETFVSPDSGSWNWFHTHPTVNTGTGYANITVSNNTPINASQAHNNLQPYVVVYMWRRTA